MSILRDFHIKVKHILNFLTKLRMLSSDNQMEASCCRNVEVPYLDFLFFSPQLIHCEIIVEKGQKVQIKDFYNSTLARFHQVVRTKQCSFVEKFDMCFILT